jgi:DNA-binding beta-propeller fold protein YncE
VLGAVVLAAAIGSPLLAVPPLVQLSGTAACVSDTGTGGACADGDVLSVPVAAAVSPDGRMVYVVSVFSNAIVAFDRSATTGALTPKQGAALCVSDDGSGGLCSDGVGLAFPEALALSPDGRHVYVAAIGIDDVTVLSRDIETGVLTSTGCISETGSGGCADGRGLLEALDVAVSPDGRNVYVSAEESDSIAIFDRNPTTGALTQPAGAAGCINETGADGCADGRALDGAIGVVVSPDGRHLYAVSDVSHAIAVFDRNPATGALTQKASPNGCLSLSGDGGQCGLARAIENAGRLTISPDGTTIYVSSFVNDAIGVFDRNLSTGILTQKAGTAGCLSNTGSLGDCTDVVALDGPHGLAVSPDGLSLYVPAAVSDAVAVFDRDPTNGTLTQKTGIAACLSETGTGGSCADATALDNAFGVTVSPDGRSVYVTATVSGSVSVFTRAPPPYDVDGDGELDALTDALLLLRFTFGFTGGTLVNGAVDLANCTRCTAPLIEAYLEALSATP